MNRERAFTVALAVSCLFALGTSAAMLEPSVSTTPDEVIDVEYASLPLPSDQAKQLKRQIQGTSPDGSRADARPPDSPATGEETDERARPDNTGDAESTNPERSGPAEDVSSGGGDERTGAADAVPEPPSLLERLFALLRALLELLLATLPWLAALLVLAAAVAFRDRIADRLRPYLDRFRPDGSDARRDADSPLTPTPSNDVAWAWVEMVDRLGLARDPSLTPAECARRAVEAGVDRDAVSKITRTFQEVEYGGRPVTDGRAERARSGLRRFREQYSEEEGT